jgi:RND family efflux transporter MFP subunit
MTRLASRALVLLCLTVACEKGAAVDSPTKRGNPSFPVEVAPVEARQVEYTLLAVGSVEAFEQVQVTARVTGVVEKVRFAEGDQVAKGAVLAEIDPDRYRIAVDAARATLVKAEAAEPDAKAALARRQTLIAKTPGVVSEEELQAYQTRERLAAAEAGEARAALQLAEVNLRDAYVRAPLPGTIQTRTVQTGQFVEAGAVLATLLRREPLLLKCEVPEQDAARLRPGMKATFRVSGSATEHRAVLTHVAGAASTTSRMVAVIGQVEEATPGLLRPGSFAEVQLRTGDRAEAPAIPQTAIRPSERGFLAFVVEGEVARERVLTLGMRTEDGRVEVRTGLKPGERLVVRGAEGLKDGAKVRLDAGPAPAAKAAP